MINAIYAEDKLNGSITLTVKGHAGAAEHGHDLVCASASILAYTLAQSVTDLYSKGRLKRKPSIKMDEGDSVITARPKGSVYEDVRNIYRTVMRGYELLMHNYPQYVTAKSHK